MECRFLYTNLTTAQYVMIVLCMPPERQEYAIENAKDVLESMTLKSPNVLCHASSRSDGKGLTRGRQNVQDRMDRLVMRYLILVGM